MAAQYILPVLSAIFLLAALIRLIRDSGRIGPASKTWLLVAVIFAVVSAWLWIQGRS
jgi:hypothetical protein